MSYWISDSTVPQVSKEWRTKPSFLLLHFFSSQLCFQKVTAFQDLCHREKEYYKESLVFVMFGFFFRCYTKQCSSLYLFYFSVLFDYRIILSTSHLTQLYFCVVILGTFKLSRWRRLRNVPGPEIIPNWGWHDPNPKWSARFSNLGLKWSPTIHIKKIRWGYGQVAQYQFPKLYKAKTRRKTLKRISN